MRRLLLIVLAALLQPLPPAADAGDALEISGLAQREQSGAATERRLLRQDLATLRRVRVRSAVYVLVADSREEWDQLVAPGLARVLRDGRPEDFPRFVDSLPAAVERLGPAGSGALLRFDLPDDRGRGFALFELPELMMSGRSDPTLLNVKRPNVGSFVSGVAVRADPRGDSSLTALYVPGLPRALVDGQPDWRAPRPLPEGGRGDFALFRGRAGIGDDASGVRRDMGRFLKDQPLSARALRPFPKDGSLGELLRAVRVPGATLDRTDGWYTTLARAPSTWRIEPGRVRHPTRLLSFSVPVSLEHGGARHDLVAGVVAFYEPVMMSPEEAASLAGVDLERMLRALQAGELPFFRDHGDVLLYRGHVHRWSEGAGKGSGGKLRTYSEARRRAEAWADQHRSRGLEDASRGPLPFRFVPIPADDQRGLVDSSRGWRGRVYTDDLAAWLLRQERDLGGEPDAAPLLAAASSRLTELGSAWDLDPHVAVASRPPRREVVRDEQGKPLAPRLDGEEPQLDVEAVALLDTDELLGERGWEDSGGDVVHEESSWESYQSRGSLSQTPPLVAGQAGLRIDDFYTAEAACRPGKPLTMVLAFSLASDGDDASQLVAAWRALGGGRPLEEGSWEFARRDGTHEVEFDGICPEAGGTVELELVLSALPGDMEQRVTIPLRVREPDSRRWAELVKPSPKPCRDIEVDLDSDDFSMATSAGLNAEQIGEALRGFQQQTLRCHGDDPRSGTIQLEMTVGCDGVVSAVQVVDDAGEPDFAACVADVMGYAPFPAHDREGGAVFEVPLTYE